MVAVTAVVSRGALLRSLAALAFTSLLGLAAIIYTGMFILVRSFDGSYAAPDGQFFKAVS